MTDTRAQEVAGISTLAPATSPKERKDVARIVNKIVRQAAVHHFGSDLLVHVYCAGLWHGSQLTEARILMEQDHADQ